ncbi:MAG: glutamate--tRNA ligase [Clostridia bacterium]|nr:glutamate--tRNA ligase [Clostridia bacterium]
MDYKKLAELLFPNITKTPEDYEREYPERNLPEGAVVTRIGPSPTGFVHLGNLFNAIIGERLAHQSGGVIFMRIEDTDTKREVPGAVKILIDAMTQFGVFFDEGATVDGDNGSYGPYRQRQRKDIYQCFAKQLVEKGMAYPCFCTEEELEQMREHQKENKQNFGYYGEYAKCRDLTYEQIEEKISSGIPYVLRYKSEGCSENSVKVYDAIKGDLEIQENYIDLVMLKSDGIPTYHFAHVIDDHLMRTTHVIRGEEWLPSLPMHVQMFDAMGWEHPLYCHTAQLMKMDGTSKRKLSKRKDPELGLEYYDSEGYLVETIWNYMLTILNSNYEEWRMANPDAAYTEFKFSLEKMGSAGVLFDLQKLNNISKEMIASKDAEFIYGELLSWAHKYDEEFAQILEANKDFAKGAINVGRNGAKPRYDLVTWKQSREFLSFYFDELFKREDEFPENVDKDTRNTILTKYIEGFDINDDQETWFGKVRAITEELGFAVRPKDYKKNPEMYKGSVVDVSNVIRVATTGRLNSPDLWEINQLFGDEKVRNRIKKAIEK